MHLKTVLSATALVLALESGAWLLAPQTFTAAMALLGLLRLLQSAAVVLVVGAMAPEGLTALGLMDTELGRGFKTGLVWSAIFGGVVLIVGLVLQLAGHHPLHVIHTALPADPRDLGLLLVVGGVFGPLGEEIFFRGLIYGFFRRWGIATAMAASTFAFVLAHPGGRGVPLPQIVGGILFAAAFEKEKNLIVPITLHVLGNLCIYTLAALV